MTCTPRLRALMILRLVRLNAAVCGLAGETTWTGPTMRGAEPVPNDPSPMRGGLAPGFPGGMGVTDWPDRCGHCGGAIAAGPGADPQGRESVSSNWLRMQSTRVVVVVLPVGQAGGELGLTWASSAGTEEQADGRIAVMVAAGQTGGPPAATNCRWGSAPGSPQ